MDKEQSTIIKGVAILMMLWYHLFGIDGLEQACTPMIYLNGKTIVAYLSNATYPVTFFLILLTYIFKQKQLNVIDQSKRLLKLYIHYWIILLVFVGLSVFIKSGMYAFDFLHILGNKNINYLLPIIILMGIKSMFKITIADGLYAFTFIILFLKLPLHPYIKNGLHHLGRYSMPMWLTHTFFCVYLFPEFIYGFKYPLLIFTALVIITYIISVPIIYISNFIIKIIKL